MTPIARPLREPLDFAESDTLLRDDVRRRRQAGESVSKASASKPIKAFIQNVHHFRDEALRAAQAPVDRIVIFDEAHQLNDIGVSLSGIQLSTGQLTDFARDLLAVGWRLARGLADWQGLAAEVDGAAPHLQLEAPVLLML